MGEALHREVVRPEALGKPCRIYAPVGGHKDLLAYLVRRLLGERRQHLLRQSPRRRRGADRGHRRRPGGEGGEARAQGQSADPDPAGSVRCRSGGTVWGCRCGRTRSASPCSPPSSRRWRRRRKPVPSSQARSWRASRRVDITSPHDRRVIVGTCRTADPPAIDRALTAAKSASHGWDALGGEARAAILDRAADLFEADRAALMGADGARSGQDARQCAGRSARGGRSPSLLRRRRRGGSFAAPLELKGPTGERNELVLAWARRVRLHLALEFPARHLHRADRRRACRRQCRGGEARRADAAHRLPRREASASRPACRRTCCISFPDAARRSARR